MSHYKKPMYIGKDTETGEDLFLDLEWFETHLHVIGPPDAGKTRFLLSVFEHLARNPRATIILVNPKGALARMARDWAIGHGKTQRLVWFDPGDPQAVIGYNPLAPSGGSVAAQAKAVREAVRSAWGQSSFDQTPQLARLLYLSLAVSLALGGTLRDALRLLRSGPAGSHVRKQLLAALVSGAVRGERELIEFLREALASFESLPERRQEELSASALARLESFVCDPAISRILTQERGLDLGELIAEHKILLVNLEIRRPLLLDDVKLLGRFIVNDVVNHVFSRPPSPDEPVYLILDEVQNFATRDLCSILDMGRELGLHCVLAHQSLGQLRSEDETGSLYASVRGCARTKFYFGGLDTDDLDVMVKGVCIEQFDPYKVKDELTTLSLDPIESRRNVTTEGWNIGASAGISRGKSLARNRVRAIGLSLSKGKSSTHGESTGTTFSSGFVSGSQFGLAGGETVLPGGEVIETSNEIDGTSSADIESQSDIQTETHTRGKHSSKGIQASRAAGESEGAQQTRTMNLTGARNSSTSQVPFYEYNKEYRVSSRTFQTEQEYLTEYLKKMLGQPQAHALVKVPGEPGRFLALPWVRTPSISGKTRAAGLARVFGLPYYRRPDEDATNGNDSQIAPASETLLEGGKEAENKPKALPEANVDRVTPGVGAGIKPVPTEKDADENFAGPEVALKPWKTKRKK